MPTDQAGLIVEGYEEYETHDELFLYDKRSMIGFKNRHIMIDLQRHFFYGKEGKDSIFICDPIQLKTLLKHVFRSQKFSPNSLAFYFILGFEDGAVIFDDSIVVRFENKGRKRGSYLVGMISCSMDENVPHYLRKTHVLGVKDTMKPYDFHRGAATKGKKTNCVLSSVSLPAAI
jgi:hypothetical protein